MPVKKAPVVKKAQVAKPVAKKASASKPKDETEGTETLSSWKIIFLESQKVFACFASLSESMALKLWFTCIATIFLFSPKRMFNIWSKTQESEPPEKPTIIGPAVSVRPESLHP